MGVGREEMKGTGDVGGYVITSSKVRTTAAGSIFFTYSGIHPFHVKNIASAMPAKLLFSNKKKLAVDWGRLTWVIPREGGSDMGRTLSSASPGGENRFFGIFDT